MNIRKATTQDIPFAIECIIESEKSGSDIFPYGQLFGIDETRFSQIISDIFDEEIPNQPWCLDHWYILDDAEGNAAAGLSCWVEGIGGSNSDLLKSQLLHYYLKDVWSESTEKLSITASVSIPRLSGFLQLEHLFTRATHRGKGYMKFLMNHVLNSHADTQAEIQLLESNQAAVSLYSNMGFIVNQRQCNEDILRLSLLSGSCKLQMIKQHG